jgi:Tfp pilus assembly protein PilV
MTQAKRHFRPASPLAPQTHPPAFSLIEVVIALGIIAFAIVAIVGMLPVALKSSQDSMRETDATLIAQRIFSELKTGSGGNRSVTTNPGGTSNQIINLAANSTNYLAFTHDGIVQTHTNTPAPNPSYDFYAQISISTNTGISNLSRIQIDITHPPSAPQESRTTNSFVTLLGF